MIGLSFAENGAKSAFFENKKTEGSCQRRNRFFLRKTYPKCLFVLKRAIVKNAFETTLQMCIVS